MNTGLDLQAQLDVMTEKLHLLEEEREKTIEYNESLKEMVKKQEVLEKGRYLLILLFLFHLLLRNQRAWCHLMMHLGMCVDGNMYI